MDKKEWAVLEAYQISDESLVPFTYLAFAMAFLSDFSYIYILLAVDVWLLVDILLGVWGNNGALGYRCVT